MSGPEKDADNIISRALVEDFREVRDARLQQLHPPVRVQIAGVAKVFCRDTATLDLRIETAAGLLYLSSTPCIVMDGNDDDVLLGRKTMQDIGIDIDRLFEHLLYRV
ncbi:hypothetical protein PHYPSEUDO_003201 [Phytophthora pseudosyringae]|uniref:Uncharacterized protein n=1 Tax=Phytophthora pseudosyringae TaxID=221518 RepID=A0A8T1VUL2_9STRA|nr:hypothetical protein PHYPSEUDO_003201 [Phytophthora pseudosyringae]